MTDILVIKTSSLGDVIHQMPALTEARARLPQARFTWLVEEAYAPLVALHPAAGVVIPVAWRRWRHALASGTTWREFAERRRELRERSYDVVVDTQGLIRSALIARSALGPRHGYDRGSIREPLASRFYDVTHTVSRDLHAVDRNRILTGKALGYEPDGAPDYGLDRSALRDGTERYAVLLHATARPEKEWPVASWIALGRLIESRGIKLVLPWGNDGERVRAERIAYALNHARVAERMPLDQMAKLIAGAEFVVGVDTGLVHLAAALGVPLAAIFAGSEPALTRPVGQGPIAVVGAKGSSPSLDEVRAALDDLLR
ncbi:MAG: Lipopolysaccharide core heptosyltransferase I [Pseudolabrys sp.]|jgi:heptosyltransferase-1|nr:Lipopolysaccharide core heptosyltransferase I [Pseudolabrys sp.]